MLTHCAERLEPGWAPRSRAASGVHCIAALIADPGTWSIAGDFRSFIGKITGRPIDQRAGLGELDDDTMGKLDAFIRKVRGLKWKIVQRGFWVHGVDNLRDYLRSAEQFTMEGRAELIRCPTARRRTCSRHFPAGILLDHAHGAARS